MTHAITQPSHRWKSLQRQAWCWESTHHSTQGIRQTTHGTRHTAHGIRHTSFSHVAVSRPPATLAHLTCEQKLPVQPWHQALEGGIEALLADDLHHSLQQTAEPSDLGSPRLMSHPTSLSSTAGVCAPRTWKGPLYFGFACLSPRPSLLNTFVWSCRRTLAVSRGRVNPCIGRMTTGALHGKPINADNGPHRPDDPTTATNRLPADVPGCQGDGQSCERRRRLTSAMHAADAPLRNSFEMPGCGLGAASETVIPRFCSGRDSLRGQLVITIVRHRADQTAAGRHCSRSVRLNVHPWSRRTDQMCISGSGWQSSEEAIRGRAGPRARSSNLLDCT